MHVWSADVGRVPLLLLDTELTENTPSSAGPRPASTRARAIRIAQYAVLGIGAVRALDAIGHRARASST